MTGRELINYICTNHLEDAEVDCVEDLFFEVPVKSVYVLQEKLESTLEYRPWSDSVQHMCAGDHRTEIISDKEARMIRGLEEE